MSLRLALALLAGAALLAPALPRAQEPGASIAELAQHARLQGTVRVILELREAAQGMAEAQRFAARRAAQERALRDLAVHGLTRPRRYEHLPFVAASLSEAALRAAAAHPDVAAIHEDRFDAPLLAQTGPLVGAPEAWAIGLGGAGQHIAILDTGVDRTHPFLAGKVVHEACFSSTVPTSGAVTACPNGQESQIGTGAAAPCSATVDCRHGTHVAGIAAGDGRNAGQSFSGIARDAKLIAIQVFSIFTTSTACAGAPVPCARTFTSDQLAALDHVFGLRQDFSIASVNMSLGGSTGFATACDTDSRKPAFDLLRSVGIATVVASGNNSFTASISAPACISSAVSVGATTKMPESWASFTNRAPILTLLAPGVSVLSSVPGGTYSSFNGTSMATPHVAAAFALLKQKKPAATVSELLSALTSTGVAIFDPASGLQKPRIFLPRALAAVGRAHADFAFDGRSDILWRNTVSGENYVYPMNGAAIDAAEGFLRTVNDPSWQVAGVGDFNGDHKADILWRHTGTGQNYVYLMNGTSIIGEGFLRTVDDQNWQVVGIGDFDGDGKDDILWRHGATGENYLYPMNGLAVKPSEGFIRSVADEDWQVAGVGDFDGDGKADILWRNGSSGQNYLYPMDGLAIKPSEGFIRTVPDLQWQVKAVGDFDGDGKADIVWRNATSGENYLYPMNGTTIKPNEGFLRTVADLDWRIVAVGDYDGDGKSDLLWRNISTGQNYLYPMDGTTIKPSEGFVRTVPAGSGWEVVAK